MDQEDDSHMLLLFHVYTPKIGAGCCSCFCLVLLFWGWWWWWAWLLIIFLQWLCSCYVVYFYLPANSRRSKLFLPPHLNLRWGRPRWRRLVWTELLSQPSTTTKTNFAEGSHPVQHILHSPTLCLAIEPHHIPCFGSRETLLFSLKIRIERHTRTRWELFSNLN